MHYKSVVKHTCQTSSATFKPKIVGGRSPSSFPLPFPYPFAPLLPFPSLAPLSLPAPSPCPPLSSPPLPFLPSRPLPFPLPLEVPLNPARCSGERCKLPQRGLGRSPSRSRICCILALKCDIWWQQGIF